MSELSTFALAFAPTATLDVDVPRASLADVISRVFRSFTRIPFVHARDDARRRVDILIH